MRARLTRLSLLIAAFIVAFATVSPIVAQVNNLEGKFITNRDGAVWVVFGGMRYRLQATLLGNDEIAAIPEGDSLASLSQLIAQLGGNAPASAPPTAPPPATPAHTLLGKTFRLCAANNTPFDLDVNEVQWTKTFESGRATGMYAIVIGSLNNVGNGADFLTREGLGIRDERGRTWGRQNLGDAALNQLGASQADKILGGKTAQRVAALFDVAEDVRSLELFSARTDCR